MFNRRFIREKTIQAYYGFFQGGAESALACQKNMVAGLDQTAQLYYLQLSFLLALSDYADEQYGQALLRGRRSEEDMEGLRMMARNKAVDKLRNDNTLILKSAEYKFNWKERQSDLIKAVYESLFIGKGDCSVAGKLQASIEKKQEEEETSSDSESAVSESVFFRHKEFLRKLYKKKISAHPVLRSFCEERSIYWESDYESACFWAYTTLANMSMESISNVDPGWTVTDEVVVFGKTLLEKTLLHQDEYNAYIASRLDNWNHERVGTTERVLLCVAVSELINFPSIPVKVTLNEYIELSKRFCTQESSAFINGVLNKIAQDLKADKKIKKSGRGLIG